MRPSPFERLRRAAWFGPFLLVVAAAGCAGKDKEEKPAPQTMEELEQRIRDVLARAGVEIQTTEPTFMKAVMGWATPDVIDRIAAFAADCAKAAYTRLRRRIVSVKAESIPEDTE